jgi:hypothetical protein
MALLLVSFASPPLLAAEELVAAEPRAYPSAEAVKPLAVGADVPSVSVRTVAGELVDLASLVAERGALLVFYRGGW